MTTLDLAAVSQFQLILTSFLERESLCLGEATRNQCRDINQQAFLTALELASQVG